MTRPGYLRAVARRAGGALVGGLLAAGGTGSPVAAAQADAGQWWHVQWRMAEVWQITDGAGVTVAVLDTGVDASVPELTGAVVPGTDLTGGDTDGRSDVDDPGHGTAMAALVVGRDGRGFPGVAPGATVLPVTVSLGGETGQGYEAATERYSDGIRYAADQGAQVISMSQASPGTHQDPDGCPAPVAEAVRYAASQDAIVVAGTGNRDNLFSFFPGNCPGVLTVGATDQQLRPWEDSHRSRYVDVTGPGVDTTLVTRGGEIYRGDGTSNATALVSGAVALVRAQFPDAPAEEVLARVLHTARDVHAGGRDDATGYGIVRPYHALTEDVPADAPNPVWEGMGDLTDAGGDDGATPADPGPAAGAEQPAGEATGGVPPVVLLAIGATVLLLVLLVVGVVAVVLARNRRPAARALQPPGTAGHRGPPAL